MAKQPNILILWGDDIGTWNISHFSRGMMGYTTPPANSARTISAIAMSTCRPRTDSTNSLAISIT